MSRFYKLTDLEISFVTTCPLGANPGAKVFLKKEQVDMRRSEVIRKEGDGSADKKDKGVNVNIDLESLSKSLGETLKKALGEMLTKKQDMSPDAVGDAVLAIMSGELTKMQKTVQDDLKKQLDEFQKAMDEKAKGKPDHKEPDGDEGKDGKKPFGKEDESLVMNGTTFKKSAVGEAAFEAIKAAFTVQESMRKEMEHTKLCQRVEKEFPFVAGAADDKANLLALIEKSDEKTKACGLAILKALNGTHEKMTKELGHTNVSDFADSPRQIVTDDEATMALEKMATEYAKKNNCSLAKAWVAVTDTPEGAKLYKEHADKE